MSSTRYGASSWVEGVPKKGRPAWPRFRGDAECEVAIVGGGLAGCMTALVFARAGVRTLLLEASHVAQQATAGGPGVFDAGAGTRFSTLRERHGLRAARHMWDQARLASLEVQALVRRLRIRCDLTRLDVIDVALGDAQTAALEREHRALTEAGFAHARLPDARAHGATGLASALALRRREAGWADPFRLTLGVARHADKLGAGLFEQSPVRRIKPGRRHVEVLTASGRIRASAVVVATGVPQPDLRALHRHVRAQETTVVVVPPPPAAVRRTLADAKAVLRDCADVRHAWLTRRDGSLMLWQTDQRALPPRQREAGAIQRSGQLMYEFSVLYPAISGVRPAAAWTASSHRSVDGLVIAGPHRAFPRHLFAVGLGADGLQAAYLAAQLNLRQYQGAPASGDELFGFIR